LKSDRERTVNKEGYAFKESSGSDWKDFQEFIEVANKYCNWIVLRNFEYLPNDFFENDKDVDVLCQDLDLFVSAMKLKKCVWGTAAYETTIDNKVVPFDVRFLGDNYYDKLWQYKMLENKIYTPDDVPRMNNTDYFYSLMYHSKVQKLAVKDTYKERLQSLALSIGLNEYRISDIENDKIASSLLNKFMKDNHYTFCRPIDINVPKNNKFYRYLSTSVKKGATRSLPKKTIILGLVLKVAVRIIPKKIKFLLKRLF